MSRSKVRMKSFCCCRYYLFHNLLSFFDVSVQSFFFIFCSGDRLVSTKKYSSRVISISNRTKQKNLCPDVVSLSLQLYIYRKKRLSRKACIPRTFWTLFNKSIIQLDQVSHTDIEARTFSQTVISKASLDYRLGNPCPQLEINN